MLPQTKPSSDSALYGRPISNDDELIEMLYLTLEVQGQSMNSDAVTLLAHDLSALPIETVGRALLRLRQSGDRLTLHSVLRHAGIPTGLEREQAEASLAWEQAREFGERFTEIEVQSETYIPGSSRRAQEKFSALTERTKATVRRIGGWSVFRQTQLDDLHWLRSRFVEQYELWEPMEYLAQGHPQLPELEGAVHRLAALKSISGITRHSREES